MGNLKNMASELARMDVAYYRINSKELTGKYQHEPSNYANELIQIYLNMNEEDLVKLYKIKTTKQWKD